MQNYNTQRTSKTSSTKKNCIKANPKIKVGKEVSGWDLQSYAVIM